MRVLITGSAGFIGKHLKKVFKSAGHTILEYDIAHNSAQDICNLKYLEQVFATNHIDIVIHCAAQKYVDRAEKNPTEALTTNIIGTHNVLYMCTKYKVNTCIYFSSDKASDPVNIYGITKNCDEQLAQYFSKQSDATRFIGLELCNVWGSTGSVVPIFIEAAKRNKPLQITDVQMQRYFMSLDQVYEIVQAAIDLGKSGDILRYKVPRPTYIIDIAKLICKKYNKEFKYDIIGNRGNEKLIEEYSLRGFKKLKNNVYKKRT